MRPNKNLVLAPIIFLTLLMPFWLRSNLNYNLVFVEQFVSNNVVNGQNGSWWNIITSIVEQKKNFFLLISHISALDSISNCKMHSVMAIGKRMHFGAVILIEEECNSEDFRVPWSDLRPIIITRTLYTHCIFPSIKTRFFD